MKDQIISIKTAKLAKKKGLPKILDQNCCLSGYDLKNKYNNESSYYMVHQQFPSDKEWLYAPTQSLLQKWLREKHGFHIVIIPTVTCFWTYKTIKVLSMADDDFFLGIKSVSELPPYTEVCGEDFNKYEDALENGMIECLKQIKNE